MSSPEELKVRESLFSSTSSDHVNASDWRCSGGGGDQTSESLRQDPAPAYKRVATRRTTATSAAYFPASSLSYGTIAGWKGGRGRPWRSLFARKPRALRRAIVASPWTSPIAAHHLAAVLVRQPTHDGSQAVALIKVFTFLCALTTRNMLHYRQLLACSHPRRSSCRMSLSVRQQPCACTFYIQSTIFPVIIDQSCYPLAHSPPADTMPCSRVHCQSPYVPPRQSF